MGYFGPVLIFLNFFKFFGLGFVRVRVREQDVGKERTEGKQAAIAQTEKRRLATWIVVVARELRTNLRRTCRISSAAAVCTFAVVAPTAS